MLLDEDRCILVCSTFLFLVKLIRSGKQLGGIKFGFRFICAHCPRTFMIMQRDVVLRNLKPRDGKTGS